MPLLQPGQSAFKPQAPITFGQPNATLNSLSQSTFGNSTNAGSTTPFIISGLKAAQPGGVNTPANNNTIKSSFVAAPSQQIATGGSQNSTSAAPIVNTPNVQNPTSNPNYNYTGGVPQVTSQPQTQQLSNLGVSTAGTAQPAPGTSTVGGPQTQQGVLQQIQQLIEQQNTQQQGLTNQEQQLTNNFTNMNAGILSQPGEIGYQTGRQAQLQNTEQQGLTQLEGQQAQLAAYEQPQINALTTAAGQLSPQNQAITPPAGGVTTIANTGQQYSNPVLGPIGSQQFYSPQPNGTSNQPSTAGQATSITIQPGQTLNQIAAQYGTTAALLAQANGITNPNNIQAGATLTIPSASQGSPFTAGVVAGQEAAGQNQVQLQTALGQARSVQTQINTLLSSNPTLNASPVAAANAVQAWAQSTAAPSGPYVNLLQDLQEYANTIAPVLGVGGNPTDNKIAIATQLVPLLASGQTIQQAIQNLDSIAVGKINAVPSAAANASQPAQQQTSSTSGGTVVQTSVGPVNTNW